MHIEFLRQCCNSLPGTTEDIKWGHDLCFSVGGKMYCVSSVDPPFTVSFKVADDEFDELSQTDGFMPAPYMARAKWVLVTDPSRLNKKEWETRIRNSYELIKSKLSGKLRRELGINK